MKKLINYLRKAFIDPKRVFRSIKYRMSRNTTMERELQAYASLLLGYDVDLKNPRTFNEKLTWMKVYNQNPLYHTLVDKYAVKKYVSDKIGSEYVVPCYGVWNNFDEIDFSQLPSQFVVKSTHYGAPVVVKDKANLNMSSLRKK